MGSLQVTFLNVLIELMQGFLKSQFNQKSLFQILKASLWITK